MTLLKFSPIVCAIGISALSNIASAELSTPRAVVNTDGKEHIIAKANFASPVRGDLYLAVGINGELLFFANGGQNLTTEVLPFSEDQKYSSTMTLFDFPATGIMPGYYPVYQVVTKPGTNPLDFSNWVGGLKGLGNINFNIGLTTEVNGDFDHNGFADDDANHDGFHDDDLNKDGFHDDDLNKDGFHDGDLNKNGILDDNILNGKKLYRSNCTGCHGKDPRDDISKIHRASNPAKTRRAIDRNKGGMSYLDFLSDAELQAIADYVKNP